jgi:non-specific serine/threonine protein kinase/serine/threonine-protein kinase
LLKMALETETHPDIEPPGDTSEHDAGRQFGPYKTLHLLGRGGMGAVYLAEQQRPFRRFVALKVIKPGMDTREVIARFESERQALALMDHPNIARVFDAGSVDDEHPYFAMEYVVSGIPITEYCDQHRLTNRERLELFLPVCQAVQHAHQKGIIHRDIKPSNLLVAVQDGVAVPKVIDFGVAKAINQKLIEQTFFTEHGMLIGTPEYMSPEQANSCGVDIDTRTDVYSLGVIFYELLTGLPPLLLRKTELEKFLRRLREEEPPKPSARLRTLARDISTDAAHKRQTEPLTLAKQIRGDLDSIALKALEKDRSRRYGSPSDLAADIGRYLRNEAVLAAPTSAAYRARKFAGRHPRGLVAAAAFLLVLLSATAVSIKQSVRANREADVAQALKLEEMNFLAFDFASQGKYAQAEALHSEILEIRRRMLGASHPDTLVSMNNLANVYYRQGNYAQAEALYGRILEVKRRVLGEDKWVAMNNLALSYYSQGKYAQAEILYTEIVQSQRRAVGDANPDTLLSVNNLAGVYGLLGKYAPAEELDGRTLEAQRRILGRVHRQTLKTVSDFAFLYQREGKYTLAESYFREALAGRRHTLGSEHPDTMTSAADLALAYTSQGRFVESEPLARETLEFFRKKRPEDWQTFRAESLLGASLAGQKKYPQAEPLLLEGYQGMTARKDRIGVPDWYHLDRASEWVVHLYRVWGQPAKADEWMKK